MTENDVTTLGTCPKCGSQLLRMWGEGWDWDHAICPERGCDYDLELDVMTGHDPDGSIWQEKKEHEEEDK